MTTKEIFMGLVSLTLGGMGTLTNEVKQFYFHHSFAFHASMSIAQFLCYTGSFGVASLTIYKHFYPKFELKKRINRMFNKKHNKK